MAVQKYIVVIVEIDTVDIKRMTKKQIQRLVEKKGNLEVRNLAIIEGNVLKPLGFYKDLDKLLK